MGAGHVGCEARERRGTRPGLRGLKRAARHAERNPGLIPAAGGILAVRRGDWSEVLREAVPEGRGKIRRVALVAHGGG
jgi:hypothetical protein